MNGSWRGPTLTSAIFFLLPQESVQKLQRGIGRTTKKLMTIIASTIDANEYWGQRLKAYLVDVGGALQHAPKVDAWVSALQAEQSFGPNSLDLVTPALQELPLLRGNLRESMLKPLEQQIVEKLVAWATEMKNSPTTYLPHVPAMVAALGDASCLFPSVHDLPAFGAELLALEKQTRMVTNTNKIKGLLKKVVKLDSQKEAQQLWKIMVTLSQSKLPAEASVDFNQDVELKKLVTNVLEITMAVFIDKLISEEVVIEYEGVIWGVASMIEEMLGLKQQGLLTNLCEAGFSCKKAMEQQVDITDQDPLTLDLEPWKAERTCILAFFNSLDFAKAHLTTKSYQEVKVVIDNADKDLKKVLFGHKASLQTLMDKCKEEADSLVKPVDAWHVGHKGDFESLLPVARETLLQQSPKAWEAAAEQLHKVPSLLTELPFCCQTSTGKFKEISSQTLFLLVLSGSEVWWSPTTPN